ncbi:MAG: S-methyl-5-thioribose-1-phosphate isomerase, partial [Lachnospiraceae bacterium]|nr:S-methyl-5-thioribose-1-phosphate isomerase [Lachnospiraceae bacterium]
MEKNIMSYETVALDDENNALVILDQTKLPILTELINLHTAQEIRDAIYLLKVRGAPAIGVAAAFGIYLLAKGIDTQDYDTFYREFCRQKDYLNSARPTAVNLSWALGRMEQVCTANKELPVAEIKQKLKEAAIAIKEEDIRVCKAIGEYG